MLVGGHNQNGISDLYGGGDDTAQSLNQGIVVIVKPEAGLWPVYRLIGALAGAGNRPGFALSSTTHTDYDTLVQTIQSAKSYDEGVSACFWLSFY